MLSPHLHAQIIDDSQSWLQRSPDRMLRPHHHAVASPLLPKRTLDVMEVSIACLCVFRQGRSKIPAPDAAGARQHPRRESASPQHMRECQGKNIGPDVAPGTSEKPPKEAAASENDDLQGIAVSKSASSLTIHIFRAVAKDESAESVISL